MEKQIRTIVVVCRGNIARSPFAAAIIQQELNRRGLSDKFQVSSRGIQGTVLDPEPVKHPNITFYPELFADAKPLLAKFKVDLSNHLSTIISERDMSSAVLVLAMDEQIKMKLQKLFPKFAEKVHLFAEIIGMQSSISDPEQIVRPSNQPHVFVEIRDGIILGFPGLVKMAE